MATRMLNAAAALLASAAMAAAEPVPQGPKNAPQFEPAFPLQTRAPQSDSGVDFAVETLAGGLVHPWAIASLPSGGYLLTERAGRLRVMQADGTLSDAVQGLPEVNAERQGGLLDVEVGPNFADDRMIYWTYAKPLGDGMSITAAARGRLSEDMTEVTEVEDIFEQEPPSPSPMHYGSRIVFDGDGRAYVTTGEHFTEEQRKLAQELDNTYGKVVRIEVDGSIPRENPFSGHENAVDSIYTYGHRNIQGADIDPETGNLWIIEHGPKGGDELNLINAGANYGWPVIAYGVNYDGSPVGSGESKREGMEQPVYYWDPVIAPAGMIFYGGDMFADWKGDLLISSLKPGGVVRLELEDGKVVGEERLLSDRGRIRDIEQAPDGALLVLVDAEDGEVLRLTPSD